MTSTETDHLAGRFPCFDGMRAFAAIAVMLHHASILTAYSLRGFSVPFSDGGTFGEYFAHMDAGVQIFFLISGFLLYRPFVAAAIAGKQHLNLSAFAWRRALRIFPAYWVAFVVISAFVGIRMPVPGARSMTEYFFLVHLYDTGSAVTETGEVVFRALGGISQSWTLVVELSFYFMLPVYAAVMRRATAGRDRRDRFRIEAAGLVALVIISYGWRALAFWAVEDGSSLEFLMPYWLPAHLDLFAMGMGLAVLRVWADTRDPAGSTGPSWCDRAGRLDWAWWLAAAVSFHIVTFWIGLSGRLELVYGGQAYLRQLLYGLTALFLLVPMVFGPQHRGPLRWVLRTPPVVYLGVISYGIYLWHQAALEVVLEGGVFNDFFSLDFWYAGWEPFRAPFLPVLLGAFVLTLAVASLSWFFVEKPILKLKGRPWFRRAPEPATT